jgi:hypothetical protein
VYRVFVGNPDRKTLLGRPRWRWEDNIKMESSRSGTVLVALIGLAQDRDNCRALGNSAMNFRVPPNAGDYLIS